MSEPSIRTLTPEAEALLDGTPLNIITTDLATTAGPPHPSLLGLPQEVRIRILRFLLITPAPVRVIWQVLDYRMTELNLTPRFHSRRSAQVLHACRKLFVEGNKVLYGENRFMYKFWKGEYVLKMLKVPGIKMIKFLSLPFEAVVDFSLEPYEAAMDANLGLLKMHISLENLIVRGFSVESRKGDYRGTYTRERTREMVLCALRHGGKNVVRCNWLKEVVMWFPYTETTLEVDCYRNIAWDYFPRRRKGGDYRLKCGAEGGDARFRFVPKEILEYEPLDCERRPEMCYAPYQMGDYYFSRHLRHKRQGLLPPTWF